MPAESVTHEGLTPYPSDPGPAIELVVSKLKGEDVELGCAIHAGWDVVGYGLGKFIPDEHDHLVAASPPYSREKVIEVLEDTQRKGVAGFPAIDWVQVAMTLLPIILEWLKQRQTP
jgi:hypothetical protein